MHGLLRGKLADLERLFRGLGFTVVRKKRRIIATKYVGIKGRWHLKASSLPRGIIKFDFHWDWLLHLAYVWGSDHAKKPVIFFRHFIKPLLRTYNLRGLVCDVRV